jgi:hypothetical protein
VIITRTHVLSGAALQQIQEQASVLDPGWLADLAIRLTADPGLRVSVITYADGTTALEVLAAGPLWHSEHTIDRHRFTRPGSVPARTLLLGGPSGLQDAIRLVRATLQQAAQAPARLARPTLRACPAPCRAQLMIPRPDLPHPVIAANHGGRRRESSSS